MSIQAVGWVLEHSTARLTDRLVLLTIANHHNRDTGYAYIGYERMAREARVSERQAMRSVKSLVAEGHLAVEANAGPRGTNVYRILGLEWGDILSPDKAVTEGAPGVTFPSSDPDKSVTGPAEIVTRTVVTNLERTEEPPPYVPPFAAFWTRYPRRKGKGAAEEAWDKAIKKGADPAAIILGAERYADDPNLPEPKYIPLPATWLNQRRWEDDPEPDRNVLRLTHPLDVFAARMIGGQS